MEIPGSGNMKRLSYMISLTVFLVIFSYHPCLAQENTGPRITLEERLYDAKDVIESTVITHEFKVFNAGDSPLEISRVSTD
jgi:hypothetical protein